MLPRRDAGRRSEREFELDGGEPAGGALSEAAV